jgi:hypothetical protein
MGASEFRRRYERKSYNSDVVFSLEGRSFAGTLKDISMGGAFVMTSAVNQVYEDAVVKVSIPFTKGTKTIKRRGRVLWTNGDGFAVEFF